MPEEVFEQVIDSDGNPKKGIAGGMQVIIEKLNSIQEQLDNILDKIPPASTG